ncbi:MAG: DNA-binding protein WhiA [Clostridia bacterium]|nr:DNA-binding protein WhiA [Clostridia bacterium]
MEKSFSKKTKELLCKQEINDICCCEAEMMGIIMFAGRFRGSQVRVSFDSIDAVSRFRTLLKICLDVDVEAERLKSSYFCVLSDKRVLSKIVEYETSSKGLEDGLVKNNCCRGAFLRGAFLGGGTVTDPKKNYNMEFASHSKKIHDEFKTLLQKMDLGFRSVIKKNTFVLYTKNSDIICDALAYMGAFSAQMEMLNVKIEREVRSDITRASNGETANMDKVMEASGRHIAAIKKLSETTGLDNLPDELREIAILRVEYEDLSLDQLGKKLVPPLSKSGVNHRLKKLLELADQQ